MSFPRSGVSRNPATLPAWQPPRRRRALDWLLAAAPYGAIALFVAGWAFVVVFAAVYDWGAL